MVSPLVARGPSGCSINVENRLNLRLYQQHWSAKIINNCCDTGNGADIELIIVRAAVSAC